MGKPQRKNNVSKASHSLNPDRAKQEKGSTMRSKTTIKRLNMYRNFKAKRDKKGHIVRAAPFQSAVASGIVSRVEPNRRWFGNTRVISQDTLQNFKEAMKVKNPYEIMLRHTLLPVSLLDEKKVKRKADILSAESFADAFGKKAKRKRPRLQCDGLHDLLRGVQSNQHIYNQEKDNSLIKADAGFRELTSDPHFKAGSSKRLWNELFKVLDSSDVVLYVLDARDPMGTRSRYIENYMKKEKPNKHFIFVINKVDLVPVWITKRWKVILSKEYPTLVFHANLTKPLGKVALMGLLRQLASLHSKDRQQISVGIIGYPNVGKSSIINAMRSKKVCKVAPLAGETKVWQYVTLLKSIYLIDCPGVVYPEGATESEMVMKGVVRVEYLHEPELYISDVLARVKPEYLQHRYGLPNYDPTCHAIWRDVEEKDSLSLNKVNTADSTLIVSDVNGTEDELKITEEVGKTTVHSQSSQWPIDANLFLELVAKKTGKLLKGGEPDIIATAKRVLNDFQRGKLPYFVHPPPLLDDDDCCKSSLVYTSATDIAVRTEQESLQQAFFEVFDVPPDVNEKSVNANQLDSEEEEVSRKMDLGFNLALACDNERSGEKKYDSTEEKALSARRRRQLERALRKKQSRAGLHFYEEVNVKNRKRHQKFA